MAEPGARGVGYQGAGRAAEVPSEGFSAPAVRRLLRDRTALASGLLFLLLATAFLAAPLYAEHVAHTTASENHLSEQVTIDGTPTNVVSLDGIPIGPTWQGSFLLGADENGRDLAVRLLYGGRTSLLIAFAAAALSLVFALPMALAAGYLGGRIDGFISRLLDLIWSFPALMLGVLLGTALSLRGAQIGPIEIDSGSKLVPIFVIGLVYIPYVARPLRGQVQALREREFVEAARAGGSGVLRVMTSELLPHLWSTVLVLTTLLLANAVMLEAALAFLGAGISPPEPSLGTLLAAGVDTVSLSPHLLLVPSATLVLIVLSLSGLAEGLRRALDPRGALAADLVRGQ